MDPPKLDTQALWTRFGAELRAWIARRVPASDVDDVLQDVFLRIHRALGTLADEERVGPWVHRVARSAVVDHLRRRRGDGELPDEPAAPGAEDGAAIQREVAGWLVPMLESLPPDAQQALRLVDLGDLSQQELSERLALSPSGARARVQRARAALRDTLLRCCHIELDRRGQVVDFQRRGKCPCCDGERA